MRCVRRRSAVDRNHYLGFPAKSGLPGHNPVRSANCSRRGYAFETASGKTLKIEMIMSGRGAELGMRAETFSTKQRSILPSKPRFFSIIQSGYSASQESALRPILRHFDSTILAANF